MTEPEQPAPLRAALLEELSLIVGKPSTGTHSCWATAQLAQVRNVLRAARLTEPYEVADVPDGSAIVTVPGQGDKPFDLAEPEQPVVAVPLRAALERELNRPWTSIRTTAAQGLFDKAKASRTQEITIAAQQLAVLLPAIESSAVFLAIRAALAVEAVRPETENGRAGAGWRDASRQIIAEDEAAENGEVSAETQEALRAWVEQRPMKRRPMRAAMTENTKFGPALWLDGRCVARVYATVEDSRITPEEPEPRWRRDAMVFVEAVNGTRLVEAVEAVRPETDIDEERLARALHEKARDVGPWVSMTTSRLLAESIIRAYRATPLAERPE